MNNKYFTVVHINTRSLLGKFAEFKRILLDKKYNICTVSETWLKPNISNDTLYIEGYNFVRFDRDRRRGGGIGMYIKNNIKYKVILTEGNIEQLWVSFSLYKKTFALGVLYKPPEFNYIDFLSDFESTMHNDLLMYDYLIALGDFNIDQLQVDNPATISFNSLLETLNCEQIISSPTRITNNSVSLIDLIVISDSSIVADKGVLDMHGFSDHDMVYCKLFFKSDTSNNTIKYRDYNNIDYDAFYADLQTLPLYYITELDDINEKVAFLNDCLCYLLDTYLPLKTCKVRKHYSPWITENIKLLISLKDKALKKYKTHQTQANLDNYRTLRNFTTLSIKNEKKAYLNFKLQHLNIKETWNELKRVNIIAKKNIKHIPTNLQKPDEINNFFVNSIPNSMNNEKENLKDFYSTHTKNNLPNNFHFKRINDETTFEILNSISTKASGVDEINIVLIKLCSPYIVPLITHLVNFCIDNNVVPKCWKQGLVRPLPKISEVKEYKDLRPICILPVLSKFLERVLDTQIRAYLSSNNLNNFYQSGFRANHSCTSALINISDDILSATDQNKITALVLLDFSKAFDTLDHDILISILHFIGFANSACILLANYLSEREQKVIVNDQISKSLHITRGVPQGSILGPLLYTIYTVNFDSNLHHCQYHFYADDTQIYLPFNYLEVQQASECLNQDISRLVKAAENHSLFINAEKSSLVIFGAKNKIEDISNNISISVNTHRLHNTKEAKNLGLIIDQSFRFKTQVNNMIKKAYSNLKLLYSSRHLLNQKLKILLCESLVLSQFNYADVLYHFCIDQNDSYRIQKIQNACLRFIYGIRRFNHVSHKLQDTQWLNMKKRRILHVLCFYHKLILLKSPKYLFNKIRYRTDVHNLNVRHKGLLSMPRHTTSLYQRSFSFNIVQHYNKLNDEFKTMSLNLFKTKCKRFLMNNEF